MYVSQNITMLQLKMFAIVKYMYASFKYYPFFPTQSWIKFCDHW